MNLCGVLIVANLLFVFGMEKAEPKVQVKLNNHVQLNNYVWFRLLEHLDFRVSNLCTSNLDPMIYISNCFIISSFA